jgi:hypothetical protein
VLVFGLALATRGPLSFRARLAAPIFAPNGQRIASIYYGKEVSPEQLNFVRNVVIEAEAGRKASMPRCRATKYDKPD